jgi:hypothetical protein
VCVVVCMDVAVRACGEWGMGVPLWSVPGARVRVWLRLKLELEPACVFVFVVAG